MTANNRFKAVRDNCLYLRPLDEILEKYDVRYAEFKQSKDRYQRSGKIIYDFFKKVYPDFRQWKECTDSLEHEENLFLNPEELSRRFKIPYWVVRYQQERYRYVRGKLEGQLDYEFEKYFRRNQILSEKKNARRKEVEYPMYVRDENIYIVVTKSSRTVSRWIQKFVFKEGVSMVGMDSEYDFEKMIEKTKSSPSFFPDLIQIATEKSCLLIQTNEGDLCPPEEFQKLIVDSRLMKLFVDPINDVAKIYNWFVRHNIRIQKNIHTKVRVNELNTDRLRKFCKCFNFVNVDNDNKGIKKTCKEVLNKTLKKDKSVTLSRWSKKILYQKQIDYAANDAIVCLDVYKMREEKKKMMEETIFEAIEKGNDIDDGVVERISTPIEEDFLDSISNSDSNSDSDSDSDSISYWEENL